jgi:hypothetical protein
LIRGAEIQERSAVIACTSLCVVAAAIGWFIYPGELTLPLALVSLIPPLGVAFMRATRNGIVDPLAVFALFFAAYNGVVLVRLNYGVDPQDIPFATDGPMFFHAATLSAIGSLGVVVGWLLTRNRRTEPVRQGSPSQCMAAYLTGITFYLVGLALYMAQYWQMGGYMQSIAMDRGQRFEMLTHTVSMPYQGFILSGLSLMMFASIGVAKSRLMLSSAACVVWLGLVLLQGDRRLALQMIMAVAVVVGTLRPNIVKLRPIAVVCIAAAYFVAVLFGQYRTLIYDVAAGKSTLKQALLAEQSDASVMSNPEQTELGAPYLSVLYYSRGTEPLRWGSSYAMSIPAFLPRALYAGAKTPAISADLAQALYEGGMRPVYGWGFSPVAEAFANFGLAGPFGAMVLWCMFFAWLASNRHRSIAGMLVCAALLEEAVNCNRIDFRYVYLESVYCLIVAVIAMVVVKAVTEITSRRREPVRMILSGPHLVPARRSRAL